MLLDSCILIDFLRHHTAATALIEGLIDKPFMSVATLSELRAGERGGKDGRAIEGLLANSILLDVDRAVAEIAGALLKRYQKSHSLEFADTFIAATAIRHSLELVTLNLKHFPMFPDLRRPY